mgnify:FL=1
MNISRAFETVKALLLNYNTFDIVCKVLSYHSPRLH